MLLKLNKPCNFLSPSAASIQYLKGTRLMIDGEPTYLCEYHPNLAQAKLTGSKQV